MRGIERVPDIFGLNVKAINIVKPAVPCFCNYGQAPPVAGRIGCAVLNPPRNDCVPRHANAVRVGDEDRPFEETTLVDPRRSCHFAVAIQTEEAGVNRIIQ